MTQIGEAVSIQMFTGLENEHSEDTCPWHNKGSEEKSQEMDPPNQDEDEDKVPELVMPARKRKRTKKVVPKNQGSTLGKNLNESGLRDAPETTLLQLRYKLDQPLIWSKQESGKNKTLQGYEAISDGIVDFPLQYAPHHLIPGNESLKGSPLVAYLGDDNAIKNYSKLKKGPAVESVILENQSVGYDVNSPENGTWLPSPYALSNDNKWPSNDGIEYFQKFKGYEEKLQKMVEFRIAYATEAMNQTGRQFHLRHADYSNEVRSVLKKIADKLEVFSDGGVCDQVDSSEDNDGKFNAPMGLVGRLNVLSSNLDVLLTGLMWHPPFFLDGYAEEYANELTNIRTKAEVKKVI